MTNKPLRTLLVDVGGTLVDDATWIERSENEALMVSRLNEAFGTDHPWFGPLASHRLSSPMRRAGSSARSRS